jgi:hypothetical protein
MGLRFLLVLILVVIPTAAMASATPNLPLLAGKLNTSRLPPPMRSNVPGTWAYDTMSRRFLAEIFPRILDDNAPELTQPSHPANSEVLLLLNDLKSSLECGKGGVLRGLAEKVSPDTPTWDAILRQIPEDERNWLDAPWVVSEFYLYRRVAEAFKYFETGYDCFKKQKASGLVEALPSIEEIARRLPVLLQAADKKETIKVSILTSLWGNKMDLSLWPAASAGQQISFGAALEANAPFILDDCSDAVVNHLAAGLLEKIGAGQRCADIVVDNAGYELVSDFILGHSLLSVGCVDKVVFHTKAHPTFVSDATTADCMETIGFLQDQGGGTADFANLMAAHVANGRIEFKDDLFFCQPTPFWDMPAHVQDKLRNSRMVFVKGDANYRRLLGEREWPLDTPAADILSYWSTVAPVCALRTFKAEIGCGISPAAQKRAHAVDKKWMVSGKWGVVQTQL